MRKLSMTIAAFATLTLFVSSAQAAITMRAARVQDGVAFVAGAGAERGALITWQGSAVTTAHPRTGRFSFHAAVPDDCLGVLSDGVSMVTVRLRGCTPASAPVPRTGQTTSYDANNPQRDDGALQTGVASPIPRFTDNSNGTITDNLTGLIWLKNASCPGRGLGFHVWQATLNRIVELNTNGTMDGTNCGDTSNGGVHQTDWRLPNVKELQSLVDFGRFNPSLPENHPFLNFVAHNYWSSTTHALVSDQAWYVEFYWGRTEEAWLGKTSSLGNVLPVRGGF